MCPWAPGAWLRGPEKSQGPQQTSSRASPPRTYALPSHSQPEAWALGLTQTKTEGSQAILERKGQYAGLCQWWIPLIHQVLSQEIPPACSLLGITRPLHYSIPSCLCTSSTLWQKLKTRQRCIKERLTMVWVCYEYYIAVKRGELEHSISTAPQFDTPESRSIYMEPDESCL